MSAVPPPDTIQLPGPVRRIGALVYDTLLVIAIWLLAALPVVAVYQHSTDTALQIGVGPAGIAYLAYIVGLTIGYYVLCIRTQGCTVGMRAWRLALVSLDAQRIPTGRALVRGIAAAIAWLPAGLGVWWQYLDPDGLGWHDRLSGTRVVILKRPTRR